MYVLDTFVPPKYENSLDRLAEYLNSKPESWELVQIRSTQAPDPNPSSYDKHVLPVPTVDAWIAVWRYAK